MAATIRFNEKLEIAVAINMIGTQNIIELCDKMSSLEAFVYVSTAYCNCDRSDIGEMVYKPPYNPRAIISLAEWSTTGIMDKVIYFRIIYVCVYYAKKKALNIT